MCTPLIQIHWQDARRIRSRILECFEQAAQPTVNDDERRALLHFVIVGGMTRVPACFAALAETATLLRSGGPTGIEFAAELNDLLSTDLLRHYPTLAPMARITVYDVAPKILAAFDSSLVDYAVSQFQRQGVYEGCLPLLHYMLKVLPVFQYHQE
mgnify:FL=1